MKNEALSDLINEMNEKKRMLPASIAIALIGGIGGAISGMAFGLGIVAGIAGGVVGWAIGKWLDSFSRKVVLFYDLDDDFRKAYETLVTSFDKLAECSKSWHIDSGGAVKDLMTWKRNAGASHLVNKRAMQLIFRSPSVVQSNLTPPTIPAGKISIHFFPDAVVIEDGASVTAATYGDINIRWQDSNFIESGSVPKDAIVVGHTWKHPNKGGGPDQRFRTNYQIPVCRYEIMHITSSGGLNALVEFSRTGVSSEFAKAMRDMRKFGSTASRGSMPKLA